MATLVAAANYLPRPGPGAMQSTAPEPTAVLAVLPVVNLDGDRSHRFLSDGITEAVIAELGRIDALRVIAPGSTRRFGGQRDAVPAVARDTGASHVLSVTLTRDGDRIRLAARLTEGSSGRVSWSSDYERGPRQFQALYGLVARDVAGAIAIDLRRDDAERLTNVRAVDPDVYESYLKGRYYWNQRTAESLRTAVVHYETAIRLDPTYAPAYAALADCYNQLGTQMVGGGSPREWRPKAAEAAIRALQIDPGLAEAHATLGYVRHYDWEWEAAEQSFQRALALNPSYPLARIWYANLLSARNRVDEALSQVTAAAELNPFSPVVGTNIGWVFINARRFAEAITALQPVVARDPGYVQAHSRLAAAYAFSGRHVEAMAEAETANRLAGNSVATRAALAQTLALAGRHTEAGRLLAQLLEEGTRQRVPTGAIGYVYAALGRADEALYLAGAGAPGADEQQRVPRRRTGLRFRACRFAIPGAAQRDRAPMTHTAAASDDITTLLSEWSHGDRSAFDRVVPLVYAELRKIAAQQLRREPAQQALQPTDLVHTLFLQLVEQRHAKWANREAFYAIAARMMRRILVNHARARRAAKRGGGAPPLSLDEVSEAALPVSGETGVSEVLAIDDLLSRLEAHDPVQARIVELRFFLGLSVEETAAAVGKAPRTVKREWRQARAWLFREMGEKGPE